MLLFPVEALPHGLRWTSRGIFSGHGRRILGHMLFFMKSGGYLCTGDLGTICSLRTGEWSVILLAHEVSEYENFPVWFFLLALLILWRCEPLLLGGIAAILPTPSKVVYFYHALRLTSCIILDSWQYYLCLLPQSSSCVSFILSSKRLLPLLRVYLYMLAISQEQWSHESQDTHLTSRH